MAEGEYAKWEFVEEDRDIIEGDSQAAYRQPEDTESIPGHHTPNARKQPIRERGLAISSHVDASPDYSPQQGLAISSHVDASPDYSPQQGLAISSHVDASPDYSPQQGLAISSHVDASPDYSPQQGLAISSHMDASPDYSPQQGPKVYVLLMKGSRQICHTVQPFLSPDYSLSWDLVGFQRHWPSTLLQFRIIPLPDNTYQEEEWKKFLSFMQNNSFVAYMKDEFYDFYVLPPCKVGEYSHAMVLYNEKEHESGSRSKRHTLFVEEDHDIIEGDFQAAYRQPECTESIPGHHTHNARKQPIRERGLAIASHMDATPDYSPHQGPIMYVLLMKGSKPICRTGQPFLSPDYSLSWDLVGFQRHWPSTLLQFRIIPLPDNTYQEEEWKKFLSFMQNNSFVAYMKDEFYDFYVLPPCEVGEYSHAMVFYKEKEHESGSRSKRHTSDGILYDSRMPSAFKPLTTTMSDYLETKYMCVGLGFLLQLSRSHASWIFGAIAELVDNSKDAKAKRLDISIQSLYSKNERKKIPVLSVIDDGSGMTHDGIVQMLTFGPKKHQVDADYFGRLGLGFKAGAMKLGKDSLVLTQTSDSRSVAFLSLSLYEKNESLGTHVVTYCKHGHFMEVDTSIQSEASANFHLQVIKGHSPFNEYSIGEKLGLFGETGTGTQIYIWNLEKQVLDYRLEWVSGHTGVDDSQKGQGDILIRNRRVRSQIGQITKEVPLDYSLQAYLEVIYLEPHMNIYVQGSHVKSRSMAKSLDNTKIVKGFVMNKPIELTLGHSQVEWERGNCGIFLYWHGRLIEAYKRVGSMIRDAEMRRGVIGVVDVSEIMTDDNSYACVYNNKQAFVGYEEYAELLKWLGSMSDKYWDDNCNPIQSKEGNAKYKPVRPYVQCNNCSSRYYYCTDFDSTSLPTKWFCYMPPFSGSCSAPKQELGREVITVASKRSGNGVDDSGEDSKETDVEFPDRSVLKKLRRESPRKSKLM